MPQNGKSGDDEWEELEVLGAKPAGPPSATKKLKRWVKDNPNAAKGLAAGGLLLVLVLVFAWALGAFSGGGGKAPVAAAPTPPQPQATPSARVTPPGKPKPPHPSKPSAQPTKEKPKQEPTEKEQIPPLPEDVAKWKKEDYFRARRENDPRLLLAVAYLSEKAQGSEPVAEGLTEMLKPLPVEQPPAASPSPAAAPPKAGATPPRSRTKPPAPGSKLPRPNRVAQKPDRAPPPGDRLPPAAEQRRSGAGRTTSRAASRSPAGLAKLVETIIAALGENGTEPAQKTLEQIVAGTLTTDDDKVAVEAALKALVAHPSPASDALLFRVLTAPAEVRPADRQGPWPADDLQTKAIALIKASTSAALRAKLAETMPDPSTRVMGANPLRELLLATTPLNCGAQQVFYEKVAADAETKAELKNRLEQQFTNYSATALARFLKIPAEGQIGSGRSSRAGGEFLRGDAEFAPSRRESAAAGGARSSPAAKVSEKTANESVLQVADLLWSEKFRLLVESQLAELRSLEKEPQLVLLAATIPQDSTRAALVKLLQSRSSDGPKALEQNVGIARQGIRAGFAEQAIRRGGDQADRPAFPDQVAKSTFPDQLLTDPGLLVLVKMLPRRDPKGATPMLSTSPQGQNRPARRPAAPGRPAAPAAAGRAGDALKPAQRKALAEQDWMAVSSKMVSVWRKRFQAAALAQKAAEEESGVPPDDAATKLPSDIALSAGAKVIASFHLRWPEDAPAGLAGKNVSPLEIHYVYAEEVNKPKKAIGFYARQAQTRLSDARPLDGAAWFDGLQSIPETGRRRSVDILVSWPGNPPADLMRDDMEPDLAVEIMTIEIKNPVSRD